MRTGAASPFHFWITWLRSLHICGIEEGEFFADERQGAPAYVNLFRGRGIASLTSHFKPYSLRVLQPRSFRGDLEEMNAMKYQEKYSIGDMSRICNISKKALRYYDNIGLITSQRQDYNNYRYYTSDSLLTVPVIKYYKQMGFKLEEMKSFIEGNVPNVLRTIQISFLAKIKELEMMQDEIHRKHVSVKDWYDLLVEAEMVIDNNIQQVSVKFVNHQEMIYQQQVFDNDIKAAIINIEFTNFLEEVGNEITGPVILNFSSFSDRMRGKQQNVRIMQKNLMPCAEEDKYIYGGCMMVSCYHIGPHETLGETYKKITTWARQNDYVLGEELIERYVTDYWTTGNSSRFVTEVLLKVEKKNERLGAPPKD